MMGIMRGTKINSQINNHMTQNQKQVAIEIYEQIKDFTLNHAMYYIIAFLLFYYCGWDPFMRQAVNVMFDLNITI